MASGEHEGPRGDGELTGRLLGGRYRVTGRIGRGGMGVVCRAEDEVLGRDVAVKILRAYTDAAASELADMRARMQREARAAARIRNPRVITVHDVLEEEGRPVIVMELIDGPSLDGVLHDDGPMDPGAAAALGAEVADALASAHAVGVLHRDVKPGNVLLDSGGRVVLTDFGIASIEAPEDGAEGAEGAARLTRSGELVGSLDYMPPERAQGDDFGKPSDVWALGMTLYAVVEGAAPFRRTSVWSTLSAIITEPLPEPRRAGALGPVLAQLLAKDPAARPDAARARELLREAAESAGAAAAGDRATVVVRARRDGPAEERPEQLVSNAPAAPEKAEPQSAEGTAAPGGRRRRRAVVVAAVAAVLALAGGATAYSVLDRDEPGGSRDRDRAGGAPSKPGSSASPDGGGQAGGKDGKDRERGGGPDGRERSGKPSGAASKGGGAVGGEGQDAGGTGSGGTGGPGSDGGGAGGGAADGGGSSGQDGGDGGGDGGGGGGGDGGNGDGGPGGTTPPPACTGGGTAFTCTVAGEAPSRIRTGKQVGTVSAGPRRIYCQINWNTEDTFDGRTNTWSVKTDDDSGNEDVYVGAAYIAGTESDERIPGVTLCRER
ncbi:serine/threonine-protein kinase [Streptomyces sp. NPDC048172]|uniref:serine/threonine-protein kinase n=1 Tax=Streptomyces sp. NPDC048172 TaxID=3365505 RepID=UPI00371C3682